MVVVVLFVVMVVVLFVVVVAVVGVVVVVGDIKCSSKIITQL